MKTKILLIIFGIFFITTGVIATEIFIGNGEVLNVSIGSSMLGAPSTQSGEKSLLYQWDSTTGKWGANTDVVLGAPSTQSGTKILPYAWDSTTNKWVAWSGVSTSTLGLTTSDISEGTNLYYTDARVASYINASTTISVDNWNTAYGWGDHSVAGYMNQSYASSTYFGLTAWYATTTDALNEGTTNQYWTNARFDGRLSGSTTMEFLTSAPNLTDIGTIADLTATLFTATDATTTSLYVGGTLGLASGNQTAGTVLGVNSSGALYWTATSSWAAAGGLSNIVEDTTPELGGNLLVHGFNITGINNLTATGTLTFANNSISDAYVVDTITASNYLLLSASTSIEKLASLTTVGTIGAGTWQATAIGAQYGGTGSTTLTGILKGNGTGVINTAVAGTDYFLPSAFNSSFDGRLSASTTFEFLTSAPNLTDVGTIADLAATKLTVTNASTTAITVSGTAYIATGSIVTASTTSLTANTLGVGTTTPTQELSVTGEMYIDGGAGATSTIQSGLVACNDGCTQGFRFYYDGSNTSTISAF